MSQKEKRGNQRVDYRANRSQKCELLFDFTEQKVPQFFQ
jgi:hypothetical protein